MRHLDASITETVSHSVRTKNLRSLGVHPDQESVDSGGGTTLYKVHVFPYGACGLKVFDLPGSELVTIYGVDNYKRQTNFFVRELKSARTELVQKEFKTEGNSILFHWRICPIYSSGLVRLPDSLTVPYTLNKWIDGESLADIFGEKSDSKQYEYGDDMKRFLRGELIRFNRMLRFDYPNEGVDLISRNVLLSRVNEVEDRYDLTVVNLRERPLSRVVPLLSLWRQE